MITSDYLRSMARSNRWQNESLYEASGTLSEEVRREDRGAFFGSIHATLSHRYWADRIWLSRFDLCEPPDVPNPLSGEFVDDFAELATKRAELILSTCARPISPPKGQAAALFDMFCGLKGATLRPRRFAIRQSPTTSNDLPTSEPVP